MSRHNRTFLPLAVSLMLHIMELTQSVGSVTGLIIPSSQHLVYFCFAKWAWCVLALILADEWLAVHLLSAWFCIFTGKSAILSKQSSNAWSTCQFVSFLCLTTSCSIVPTSPLVMLLTLSWSIHSSSAFLHPRIEELPGWLDNFEVGNCWFVLVADLQFCRCRSL